MNSTCKQFSVSLLLSILAIALIACSPAPQPVLEEQVEEQVEEQTDSATTDNAEPAAAEAAPEVASLELARDIDVQTVASVLDRDDVFLLDVREVSEHEAGHIAGNTLIPTGSVADRLAEIPTDQEVIVYCHSGARSARVTAFLEEQGYTNIHNMLGGIVAWENAGLDVE